MFLDHREEYYLLLALELIARSQSLSVSQSTARDMLDVLSSKPVDSVPTAWVQPTLWE